MARAKVNMVDTAEQNNEQSIEVDLIACSDNELVGEHTIFTSYGRFVFVEGKAAVSKQIAKMLKDGGYVK